MLDDAALVRGIATQFMRRPAMPIALAFTSGIAAESMVPCRPLWGLILATTGLILAAIFFCRAILSSCLLLTAIALIGLVAANLETNYFTHRDIALFTTDSPRFAQLELLIDSPPRLHSETGLARPLPPRQLAHAQLKRILTQSGWKPADGDVELTLDQPHPELAVGQTIHATGTLQRPLPASNPGQINWAAFYRRERVLTLFTVSHADAIQITARPTFHPLESLRAQVRQRLAEGFTPSQQNHFALLEALTLGDRDASIRDTQEDFAHSGTAHLLAVSGLHVVLVAWLAMQVLGRIAGLHPRTATILVMLLVLLYSLIVVPGTPALRATTLCIAYGVNRFFRQRPDGLQLLALCSMGLLIWHPHDLGSSGFQLSFFTVAGMLIAGPRVVEMLHDWVEDEHTRIARSFRPPTFWAALAIAIRNSILDALAISLVAWIVSLPLVIHHYEQANPWAIFAGLLALPIVALSLIGGLLKILLTFALPSFAGLWATLADGPITLLRGFIHWLASWPGANFQVPPMPYSRMVIVYALLILPLLPWTWKSVKKCARCSPLAACGFALLPLFGFRHESPDQDARATLLAIGAGQVGVIELPGHHVLLIDDGSSTVPDPLRQCLAPYLRSRGLSEIDTILLSHPDFDHISAAADTAEAFHAHRVLINPVFRIQSLGNIPAESMLDRLDQLHIPVQVVRRGEHIPLAEDIALDILWPPQEHNSMTTNNAGLVVKLTAYHRTVLFPADIQVPTEQELLAHSEQLRSDILVAPHHGSAGVHDCRLHGCRASDGCAQFQRSPPLQKTAGVRSVSDRTPALSHQPLWRGDSAHYPGRSTSHRDVFTSQVTLSLMAWRFRSAHTTAPPSPQLCPH